MGGVCTGQSIVHFLVDLRIWRDCATQIVELVDNCQLGLVNEDSWLILLFMGEGLSMTSSLQSEVFQSRKLFAATLLSFIVEEGGIGCPKVFLWSCRCLRLNRLPSVCKWIYFPLSLLKSCLSIMLKRTVNGVRARRRLSLKPSEELWQVVGLSDLDWSCSKPAATWLFQDSLKTFSAHGLKCFGPDR